eukprot:COSAG01_NODE_18987_length_1038_cov_80.642173_2_plen_110_part_01
MVPLLVEGVAFSGGGRGIARVEVSAGGGEWASAELHPPSDQPLPHRRWAWTRWTATLPVAVGADHETELRCRATDIEGETQPPKVTDVWTPSGYLCNAQHSVKVVLPQAH